MIWFIVYFLCSYMHLWMWEVCLLFLCSKKKKQALLLFTKDTGRRCISKPEDFP